MKKTDGINVELSEVCKDYEQKMKEKRKFIKHGSNVIHLEYLGSTFSDDDISDFEKKIKNVGLELSRFDTNGEMYATFDEFKLVIFIVIAQPLIGELVKGVLTNATWDAIKYVIKTAWMKTRNKTYTKMSSQKVTKKQISFGLKLQLDKDTNFDFKLSGDMDEKMLDDSLDKVLRFFDRQQLNKEYKQTYCVSFCKEKQEWRLIDEQEKEY
jgi:hypothetical protein